MRILACIVFLFVVSTAWAGESLLSKSVDIALPFASKPNAERGYADIPLKTIADAFVIDFECDVPDAIGGITFYLHSGKGWYSYALPVPDDLVPGNNRVQMEISPAALTVRIEGQPGPVAQADTIRFAIWRGASKDATVKLHDIRTIEFPIVLVIEESDEGKEYGSQFLRQMSLAGIPAISLSQRSLTEEKLKNAKVVVLPLNYKLPPEIVTVLQKFVENGGHLVAFFQLPPELMKTLGFEPGRYVKSPQDDTALAEIRFDHTGSNPFERVPDLKQKSWNIVVSKPIAERGAYVAGRWFDAAGRETEYPALLVSERGAFVSHILTPENRENKQKFLVELFGLYDSSFRYNAVVKAWKSLFQVGDARTMTAEKRAGLEKRMLIELRQRGFTVDAAFFTKDTSATNLLNLPKLHDTLLELREKLVREYCQSVSARTPEFRAWWEHAGLGAYPGDWDRTMKELSEAGFNAVISNLLWGGSAHYASNVLPRSKKYEQYGDQIEQAVAAGKKYGVEVHAWQVCYRLSGSPPEFVEAMKKSDRIQVSFDGTAGEWLCPSHPENVDLETATFVELAKKYKDLDGIHYDYIRFPDGNHCFCNGCRDRFSKDTGIEIKQWPADVRRSPHVEKFEQWRCDQISKLVERVHREVKAIRSDLKISAAVFSQYPGCRRGIGQDWAVWVENGWLDFLCPMNYTESLANFEALIERQKPLIKGRIPLYPGIGATATGIAMMPDRVVSQIEITRKMDVPGFVIFNLDGRTIQRIPPFTKLGATKH